MTSEVDGSSPSTRVALFKKMPRPRAYRVTLYLHEEFKNQSDRMWNNLMALDVVVVEEHLKAGVLIAETEHKDVSFLQHVPGVSAFCVQEPAPEAPPEPVARVLSLKPGRDIKPMNGEKEKRGRQIPR